MISLFITIMTSIRRIQKINLTVRPTIQNILLQKQEVIIYYLYLLVDINSIIRYTIENNDIIPYSGESTIEGNLLMSFGMKQSGKNSYTSDYMRYYLFDVVYEE